MIIKDGNGRNSIYICPTKMKRAPLTYHLLLALVGGYAILAFARINKHNFYHHYYRVIEEVQTRNSQEWEAAATLTIFAETVAPTVQLETLLPTWIDAKWETGLSFSYLFSKLVDRGLDKSVWYFSAHPAQAP